MKAAWLKRHCNDAVRIAQIASHTPRCFSGRLRIIEHGKNVFGFVIRPDMHASVV